MDAKKRILFIVPLPPPIHGTTVMCQHVKDSKLINEGFDCDYVNLSTSRNTNETGKFKFSKIGRFICLCFIVLYKLLTHRYDLCYIAIAFHKGLLKDAPFVFMCKLLGRNVVLHLHGKGASEDANNPFYHWLLCVTFNNTKVIMLSWLLYADVKQFVKREDVSICPNGIPIVNFKRRKKENLIPRLLYLSNMKEEKGVIVLLDALTILKKNGYLFRCDFVGGESKDLDAERFRKEVEKRGLNGSAFYLGRKYGDAKEDILEKADVFVFPTYYKNETFGLVNLEAMTHRLPIVTTNEGGIPDVVVDGINGLISVQKDPFSLASCISQLLDNKDLCKKMGDEGRRRLQNYFSLECFEKNIYGILSQLIVENSKVGNQ